MKTWLLLINLLSVAFVVYAVAQEKFETDIIKSPAGDLKISFIGHGTLIFNFGGKVIHVDPYSDVADYITLPNEDQGGNPSIVTLSSNPFE